ncbi:MAG: CsgG/HfaB family protein [Spirochaetaceae bacterium]
MKLHCARVRRIVAFMLLIAVGAVPAFAQRTTVAFVNMENAGRDPAADYLGGIIEGLLLFDLSTQEDIALVERASLEEVISEQRLALSGLAARSEEAQRVGELLGADYLVTGDYVFLGEEVLINARVVEVETAETVAFSERGRTENTVHRLAEKLIAELSGSRVSLADPASDRSIISMRDERPGTIALYSPLVDAEITVDGEFVGYTHGDMTEPVLIEDVEPGRRTISTNLGIAFGVAELPEFTFSPWREDVLVRPDRRSVVRDRSRSLNSIIYDQIWLVSEDESIPAGGDLLEIEHDLSFTNRSGRRVPLRLSMSAEPEPTALSVSATVDYAGTPYEFELLANEDEGFDLSEDIGIVRIELAGEWRYEQWELDYSVRRIDIEQGMFRD